MTTNNKTEKLTQDSFRLTAFINVTSNGVGYYNFKIQHPVKKGRGFAYINDKNEDSRTVYPDDVGVEKQLGSHTFTYVERFTNRNGDPMLKVILDGAYQNLFYREEKGLFFISSLLANKPSKKGTLKDVSF